MTELRAMDLIRLRNRPERGVGLVLVVANDQVWLFFESGATEFRLSKMSFEKVGREDVEEPVIIRFMNADRDALDGIPEALHAEIRRRWYVEGMYGKALFNASGSRGSGETQKALSEFLGNAGIMKGDPRWERVIGRGRDMYYA